MLCLVMNGCGGCRRDPGESDAKAETSSEKDGGGMPKEAFAVRPLVFLPGQFSEEVRVNRHKPGHLAIANLRVTSSHADVNGRLRMYPVTSGNQPVSIAGTGFYLETVRPVTLAKGEEKSLDALVFLPHRGILAANVSLRTQMLALSGIPLIDVSGGANVLQAWQYHLVLLSPEPDQWKFLQAIDCVQIPSFDQETVLPFYHIVRTEPGKAAPLPPTSLAWTTIAFLVWDGFDPTQLEESQQRSMLDWLHFGGQLIINGPTSLDSLQNSFLASSLPAVQKSARNLVMADLEELNRNWAVPNAALPGQRHRLEIPDSAPLLGVELSPAVGARVVDGTGGWVVERRVGRGRIVVTGFSLVDPRVRRWVGLASFMNGALFRKPHRRFERGDRDEMSFVWHAGRNTFDAALGTTLGYIARDLKPKVDGRMRMETDPEADFDSATGRFRRQVIPDEVAFDRASTLEDVQDPRWEGGLNPLPDSGMAGWNDELGIAGAARRAITGMAGIRPPSRRFVLQMLAGYLLVLVPLNWAFFRLLGRVEWAWIAAPLISLVAAISVVRMASLDIGFARSQTSIGLLEVHGGYPRAHLSEYSALYTSLSTNYALQFDDSEGVAMPFRGNAVVADGGRSQAVSLERTVISRLNRLPVKSNWTGTLHLECMTDLAGSIRLDDGGTGGPSVVNTSRIGVIHAGLVRCSADGSFSAAWIGDLPAGESREVEFQPIAAGQLYSSWSRLPGFVGIRRYCREFWTERAGENGSIPLSQLLAEAKINPLDREGLRAALAGRESGIQLPVQADPLIGLDAFVAAMEQFGLADSDAAFGIGELFDEIATGLKLMPGECRLLGEVREPVGTHRLQPGATQSVQSTMLVVHLAPAILPAARPDDNALRDFLAKPDQDRWLKQDGDSEPGSGGNDSGGAADDQRGGASGGDGGLPETGLP